MASKYVDGVVARHLELARDRLVLFRKLGHPLLDRLRDLPGVNGALVGKIVVEAILDHRADGHLRVGKELLDRVGEKVRRRMAHARRDPAGSLAVTMAIDASSIDHDATCRRSLPSTLPASAALARPGPIAGGDIGDRYRRGELLDAAVRQCDLGHGVLQNKKVRGEPHFSETQRRAISRVSKRLPCAFAVS